MTNWVFVAIIIDTAGLTTLGYYRGTKRARFRLSRTGSRFVQDVFLDSVVIIFINHYKFVKMKMKSTIIDSLSIDEFHFHQSFLIPGHQPLVPLLYVAGWTIVWLSNLQVVFTIIIFSIVITTSTSKSFHPDVSWECDIYIFSGLNEEQVKIVSVTSRQEEVCSHSS